MELKKIKSEELLFTNGIEDDRTNTFLSLDDYDWMSYRLKTRFKTLEQGILDIEFMYFGMTYSCMDVEQTKDGKTEKYRYEYSSSVFQKHIVNFLKKHIEYWNDKYAFNGEEEVINFYNEVLDVGKRIVV